ncbi:glycosyl hydrolase [Streptomyces sp. WMMB303]|uniref:glycoside hydrolase family 26 protein n=1 Tax=Streptomyces sp. WMMB303 TaxID=3034154 RepID=UPI0023ECF567|nr:glycosyl hydrolase [Streptomyces sp. WMMB303]MDF4252273.1 glycosyl hydrolase [Streptomyces sp. WMMB303]
MRSHRRQRIRAVLCGGILAAGLLASCTVLPNGRPETEPGERPLRSPQPSASPAPSRPASPSPSASPSAPSAPVAAADPAVGAFLGSGPEGVRRIRAMERWLGGTRLRVGHTYLPGRLWSDIEGPPRFLEPWARWRHADPDRLLVLNVPMAARNEAGLSDARVRTLLREGAAGHFDSHYRKLAERLVRQRLADTVLVLGWEMNGTTYTHRCGPDPKAWKAYWRRIVTAMRAVAGQRFRFDFAPSRGRDAIPWPRCYPGDDVVDVLGMDAYDQPRGLRFEEQVREPYGLQAHVDFAARHRKPVSYPEWGLFRNGDNTEYTRRMLEWMDRYKPLYQTISDYCPHGVWRCSRNPASAAVYRAALGPGTQPPRQSGQTQAPGHSRPVPPPSTPRPWWDRCWGPGRYCVRLDWLRALGG